MTSVEVTNVVKRYGALEVIHDISLAIEPQEFVVLVGPSGCGKSTTLRMIAGLEEISGGTVSISGRVVNRVAPKDRDVAMVFQNYALYPHLNVAENIAFGLRVRGEKRDVVEKSVAEAAAMLGLTEYLKRKPADLSGGQRQRVAMGRAIVRRPKVFLFDEPLSNLDAKLRTQMRAEIKRLHRRLNVTSVYVTHDQVEAMTLADRIVIMNGGNIEQVGSPMEVFLRPANTFVAGFIGSPPMNLIEATVATVDGRPHGIVGGGERVLLPDGLLPAASDGKPITIGVRPEAIGFQGGNSGLACEIDLVEPLGAEALVHGRVSDQPFVAKTETPNDIGALARIGRVHFDVNRIHLFDRESGRVLSHA